MSHSYDATEAQRIDKLNEVCVIIFLMSHGLMTTVQAFFSTAWRTLWLVCRILSVVIILNNLRVLPVLLPVYDCIITFDQEIAVVWRRDGKLSLGSILIVSTRWRMVMGSAVSLVPALTSVRVPHS